MTIKKMTFKEMTIKKMTFKKTNYAIFENDNTIFTFFQTIFNSIYLKMTKVKNSNW